MAFDSFQTGRRRENGRSNGFSQHIIPSKPFSLLKLIFWEYTELFSSFAKHKKKKKKAKSLKTAQTSFYSSSKAHIPIIESHLKTNIGSRSNNLLYPTLVYWRTLAAYRMGLCQKKVTPLLETETFFRQKSASLC